ncbi:hypothetical protein FK498_03225 [Elioraea sp. Yellowstone]|jgi:hypothetical protein|uniref:hypothetical protein n=1 Tax=Elioraea sp. Yellowstone TaxID=2592070 RepID=UPI0011538B49|nr:hypothetical protein [Elioraea sp. Yellowstone]TQF83170.1 hypothetical protein FK498_03225 [Elioraea sp. Yellowstone]
MSSRRALLGLFATVAVVAPARAFRVEPLDVPSAADWSANAACARSPIHDELRAEIAALLKGRDAPPDVAEAVERLSVCPFCRCVVTATAAGPPRF